MTSGIVKTKAKTKAKTLAFGKSYFEQVFGDLDEFYKNAETQLNGLEIKFDSFVGIGLSGILALPLLARHFDVPYLALRKDGVDCHDTYGVGQYGRGTIGKRWVLIDDFVSSGRTIETAIRRVKWGIQEADSTFETTYVGCYCYGSSFGNSSGAFVYPDGTKMSVKKIEVDGEEQTVNGELFSVIRNRIGMYYRRDWSDPKGKAIRAVMEDSYYYDRLGSPSLDEIAMIAVAAEKEYLAETGRNAN